ncbi:MAG: restriction endonuclease [Nitrososphaera sp.]|nr:restriction endonuclease [Nitrososphaera sp.]
MQPGPVAAAELIRDGLSLDAAPRRVVEIVVEISLSKDWVDDPNVAREYAERWETSVLARLRAYLTQLNELGRPAKYTFNSSSDDMVQGACFLEPGDSEQLADKKRRRFHSYDYYSALQKLTPTQFELLSGKIIGLLGVQKPVVTRTSADEGIDFYGKLALGSFFYPNDLSPTVQQQMNVWLVGQAKHYIATQSGTPELRDLVGAIELGRAKVFGSSTSPIEGMDIRVADPVFAVFITTGSISLNGWNLLKRSGVVGLDGEMVAAFLADRGAGMDGDRFASNKFMEWLDS